MKIVHIQFGGPFTENTTYQENMLTDAQAKMGNEVFLWCNCYKWNEGHIEKTPAQDKILDNGVHLRRYRYYYIVNNYLTEKLRITNGLYRDLEAVEPDIIMVHGPQSLSCYQISKYMKNHRNVGLVIDSHSDSFNTARNWFSVVFLHKILYKPAIKEIMKWAIKMYCVSIDTIDFMADMYGVDRCKMEYLPLGGHIFSNEEYSTYRKIRRNELALQEDDILIVHSGKLVPEKKTSDLLSAFMSVKSSKLNLIIIGSAETDVLTEINNCCASDQRIRYLGWKSGKDLEEYLCAADVYAQPGTQSATLHNAICCRCTIIARPYRSYLKLLGEYGIFVNNPDDISNALEKYINGTLDRNSMEMYSQKIADEMLDYSKQAKKIIDDAYKYKNIHSTNVV